MRKHVPGAPAGCLMADPLTSDAERAADPNRWAVLALLGTAQLMVVLDATIVNIALPSAQKALHFSPADREWIVTAYALAFGSLLLLGGKLGDLFGRKWTFIAGLVALRSSPRSAGGRRTSTCCVRPGAARHVRRAAAPSALGLLTVTFAGSPDWAKAFGIFGAIAGGGASVGLVLGGALTQFLSWRWCLYVNLVIVVPTATLRAAPPGQPPRSRAARHRRTWPAHLIRRTVRARLRLLERRYPIVDRHGDDRRAVASPALRSPSRSSRAASSTPCCRCISRANRARGGPTSRCCSPLPACSACSSSSPTTCS